MNFGPVDGVGSEVTTSAGCGGYRLAMTDVRLEIAAEQGIELLGPVPDLSDERVGSH
jgi:hypothetical protein